MKNRRAAAHKQALQDSDITNSAQSAANSQIVHRLPRRSSNGAETGNSSIVNPAEAGEAPLSADELAALRALGGEINPAQIAADAEYMAGEMLEGLRGACGKRDHHQQR